jgi:hypothetical protein
MKLKILLATLLFPVLVLAKAPELSEDYATIHLYRKNLLVGALWNFKVKVNDKKVKVKNGNYYEIRVKPGDVRLKSLTARHSTVGMNIEAGKHYYVKTYMRAGMFWNFVELAEVTERYAEKDAEKAKKKKVNIIEI